MSADRVTRTDIEAKLAEIRGEIDEDVERARGIGIAVAVVAVAGVALTAYFLGRRRGRRRQAVVEVLRV